MSEKSLSAAARAPQRVMPQSGRLLTLASIQGPWRPSGTVGGCGVFAAVWATSSGECWAPLHDFEPADQLRLIEQCRGLDQAAGLRGAGAQEPVHLMRDSEGRPWDALALLRALVFAGMQGPVLLHVMLTEAHRYITWLDGAARAAQVSPAALADPAQALRDLVVAVHAEEPAGIARAMRAAVAVLGSGKA